MKIAKLFALTIILSISIIVSGQESEVEEFSDNPVPENAMREVVRRILVYKFKPVKRKKVIYFAQKGIDKSWLPEIENIEFRLLSNGAVEDRDSGVYFFTKPQLTKNTYEINFAFGNPDCEYIGDSWNFRIANNKVRLWYSGEIGGGCGGRSFGEFSEPGKLNTYPNELKGYEFFDKGKLQGLKLAVSTREDVKNNFGNDCDNLCEYNERWEVYFTYFDNISFEKTENAVKTKYIPQAQYVGKIYSIELRPKLNISFDKIVFPSKYRKSNGYAMACDGKGSSTHTSYDSYSDRYGLIYTLFGEVTFTTDNYVSNHHKKDLTRIEYTVPDKLKEKMFVEEK